MGIFKTEKKANIYKLLLYVLEGVGPFKATNIRGS